MPTIRQEINILNTSYTGTGTVNGNERVLLDTDQFSGTVTYYFEAVYSGAASNTGNIRLTITGGTTDVATVSGATSATVVCNRSSFTPTTGQTELFVRLVGDGTRSQTVKAARIVIIQTSAGPISSTETQIEIGSNSTSVALSEPTGATNTTNPKYWKYVAANWSGPTMVRFEATIANPASSKSSATAYLQVDDGSFGATWTRVTLASTSSTTAARSRPGTPITLVDGRHYRVVLISSSSKTAAVLYGAKIIISQCTEGNLVADIAGSVLNIAGGNGFSNEAQAQSFQVASYVTLSSVVLEPFTVGSPADSLKVDIVTSLGGSSLGSATVPASSMTSSATQQVFAFSAPIELSSGTTYYIQITRSPDSNDSTNFYRLRYSAANLYSGGGVATRSGGTWGAVATNDSWFKLNLIPDLGILNFEAEYLLANTLFTAGTAAQTFLTKWDPAEWSTTTGLPTFNHDVEAGAATTSTIELDNTTGPAQLTGSVVTNPSSEGISSAVTMPAAATTLDVKATTNGGNLTASRILAIVNLGPVEPPQPIIMQAVKRAALW